MENEFYNELKKRNVKNVKIAPWSMRLTWGGTALLRFALLHLLS